MADDDREARRRWVQHMARYVISDDCAPRCCASKGAVYTDDVWLSALLHLCGGAQLLVAITAGTLAAGAGHDALVHWTAYGLDQADAGLDTLLRDVLEADGGGPPRVLVARQPLLLALQLALERDPPADPIVVATLTADSNQDPRLLTRRTTGSGYPGKGSSRAFPQLEQATAGAVVPVWHRSQ